MAREVAAQTRSLRATMVCSRGLDASCGVVMQQRCSASAPDTQGRVGVARRRRETTMVVAAGRGARAVASSEEKHNGY